MQISDGAVFWSASSSPSPVTTSMKNKLQSQVNNGSVSIPGWEAGPVVQLATFQKCQAFLYSLGSLSMCSPACFPDLPTTYLCRTSDQWTLKYVVSEFQKLEILQSNCAVNSTIGDRNNSFLSVEDVKPPAGSELCLHAHQKWMWNSANSFHFYCKNWDGKLLGKISHFFQS
jgi:hypothetical protein